MSNRRVVVTGMGVVASNGIGTEAFWHSIRTGVSGISRIEEFDTTDYDSKIAGRVRQFDPLQYCVPRVAKRTDRSTHLALAAASMAVRDSGLAPEQEDRQRIGICMGSGIGGMFFYEVQILNAQKLGLRHAHPLSIPRITPNAPASYIASAYGLLGPNFTICTACSSGGHAIGQGRMTIASGAADIMISGGTEAPIVQYTFRGFDALQVLAKRNDAPEKASRPFDRDRDGFVLAEGSGVLVLEELEHARRRGARIYGEVAGYGATCGAYNIVIPVKDGSDAAQAIRLALGDAGVAPEQIDYVNAHGTSTQANDSAETRAIKLALGAHAQRVPVSATKSTTGHAIGAAGAIEAIACLLVLQHQIIPPTTNYENADPECDLDYVPNEARPHPVRVALSNSFGFGNNNATLVFKRVDGDGREA